MKKYIVFFLLFFLPISVSAQTSIGLGDSITTGYGTEKGYFEQICEKKKNEDSKVQCENLAVDGLTSFELLNQLEEEWMIGKIKGADFIYMSIGGNDFLGDISKNFTTYLTGGVGTAKETGETLLVNMRLIYEKIHSINPKIEMYVVPLYNPYFEVLAKNKSVLSIFADVKKEYVRLAQTFSYVHISSTLGDEIESKTYLNASLTNIDPHPNALGHTLIAEKIGEEPKKEIPVKKKETGIYIGLGICLFLVILFMIKKIFTKK